MSKTQSSRDQDGPPRALLGSSQVAAWLGMSREQVWKLWQAGQLPGYKLDRHVRFAPADVESFLALNYTGGNTNKSVSPPVRHASAAAASSYRRI